MEKTELAKIIEALLFITDSPLSPQKIKELTGEGVGAVRAALDELMSKYFVGEGALFIKEVAGGFQMATKPELGEWVKKLYQDKITYKLSKSALETLSIIAYKQPVTRSEIEEIRGVDSSGVLENLLEKKLVKICGRKEVAGRPMLYGTTQEFLKYFGLKNLADLPSLEELVPPEEGARQDGMQDELPMDAEANDESGQLKPATDAGRQDEAEVKQEG